MARQTDQWNRRESPEINTATSRHPVSDKGDIYNHWGKDDLLTNGVGTN